MTTNSKTFVDYTTPAVNAAWLNDVDAAVFNERVSVLRYGSVDLTGATSAQVVIQDAVSDAYNNGYELFWPAGTYLSTGNITNFHLVKHFGPGVVKRGSDLFNVRPVSEDTNILYLATTGSASNDGLSASEPMDTLTVVWTAMQNYGPLLVGKWKIQHAAGTYGGYHRVPYNLTSEKLVEILGPAVGGHPNVPTCIYDWNGASMRLVSCVNDGMKIMVQDIKVQESAGTAILMSGGLLYTKNVHSHDCDIGIGIYNSGDLYVSGGLHTRSTTFNHYACIQSQFNSRHSIGYDYDETTGNPTAAANIAATPQLTGTAPLVGRGVHLQEGATGHIYALISTFSKGVELFSRSRANLDTSDIRLCGVGVEVEYGCDVGGSHVLNKGTGNANTQSISYIGGGMNYNSYASPGAALEYRVAQDLVGESVTGSTNAETIGTTLYTLDGQDFDSGGSTLRMVVAGTFTGTAGTKSIQFRIAGTNMGSVPFAAAAVGAFHAEIVVRQIANGSQVVTGWGVCGQTSSIGASDVGQGTATVTVADGTTKAVTCSVQLGNSADTIDVDVVELFRTN